MASLEIRLLGRPQVRLQGQLIEIKAAKAQALLAYIVVTRQRHSRQALAGLLWSDLGEESARRNLRGELKRVRDTIGPDYLFGEYETIELSSSASLWTDITEFDRLLNQPNLTAQQLQETIDLYRGPFLDDFHVREAALFEEWMGTERERLLQAVQRASLRLIKLYIQQRNYEAAFACAHQLLSREPWLEEAHQLLMRLYALTGQRSEAIKQYETLSKALVAEFGADVLPAQETEDLYDQIVNEEIRPDPAVGGAAFVLAPASLPPPFQAPQELLHFVGREYELAQVRSVLLAGTANPLCAIVGMGGLGKSALAGHLAHQLREEFPDGVLWAYVATSDPLDILGNWARAFGYDFSTLSDVENRAAALRGALADKRVLIILDDVRGTARTRPLLLGGARCATLITTRDHDVAVALTARPFRLPELALDEGVRLLTRILGEERVAAEPDAAQTICRQLQNLPLAVEITAQRLVSRGRRRLADMAERLRRVEERLDLSISDRAVRTSFMVSWEALDSNLRHAFERLAVFEGRAFTADALAHIGELDLYTAEDRLFELQRLSLVSEAEEERYRQHPLLADFAREQLGENIAPLVDMAIYYQQFAERHRTNYLALRPEWDNLMAGMGMAHKLEQWSVVLAYAETLTQAWFVRGRFTQARQGYALVWDAARALALEQTSAATLLRWGQAVMEQNDYEEAKLHLTESLNIYQQLEDIPGIASAEFYLGRIALEQAQYELAESLLRSSQQRREQTNDGLGLANTIYEQALLAYRLNDIDKSKELCRKSLKLQEKFQDASGLLPTLRLLADIALEQHEYALADSYLKRSLELCNELQNRGELAATYYGLAVVARVHQKFEQAETYVSNVLELSQLIGNRRFQAMALYEKCWLYGERAEYEPAIEAGLRSLELFRQLEDSFNMVYVLCHLGDFYHKNHQLDQADELWQEANQIIQNQNHPLTATIKQRINSQ
jgi:DNA-binding SARP family transcriptional activator